MKKYKKHLILKGSPIKKALELLNDLSKDAILFVVDGNDKLIGSLTDGDVRRGLLDNFTLDSIIDDIIQPNPRCIRKSNFDIEQIITFRTNNYRVIPVVDDDDIVINVVNFRKIKSYLPVDVVIMAGGRGQRLQPLTDKTPKPLLQVGGKAILEHNLDRLVLFGMSDFWISVKYMGEQIQQYFGSGKEKNINIEYVWEREMMGTIGAVSKIKNFSQNYILVTNSDLLTNIDYEHFFLEFVKQEADLAVLTIPYHVDIPYAVLETINGEVKSFTEKPTYTYYSNGGIYLIRREILSLIPENTFYNATDLMNALIQNSHKIISIPFYGYWLDIGKHEDFEKAQLDVKNIEFN